MAQKTWVLQNWIRRVESEGVREKTTLIIFIKKTKAKGGIRKKRARKIEKDLRFFH